MEKNMEAITTRFRVCGIGVQGLGLQGFRVEGLRFRFQVSFGGLRLRV